MMKLLKAGGKAFGYMIEALRPLTEAERKEAGIWTASEYQQMKNEQARLRVEKAVKQ